MKSFSGRVACALIAVLLASLGAQEACAAGLAVPTANPAKFSLGDLPIYFEPNQGQFDPEVQFITRGPGYHAFLTPGEVVFSLRFAEPGKPDEPRCSVVRMRLVGADPDAVAMGVDEQPGKVNYFVGNDPAKRRSNVPTFAKVRYKQVYPGVDLVYYGRGRLPEFDLVLSPGAVPGTIRLAFDGLPHDDALEVSPDGDLVVHTSEGDMVFRKPHAYQEFTDGPRDVEAGYRLEAGSEVCFDIGAHDPGKPLVIDPYAVLVNGTGEDAGEGIAVDVSGNAYITGFTASTNFAGTVKPGAAVGKNAFVLKLSSSATVLYTTYIGGDGDDEGEAIALGTDFNNDLMVYVTGTTKSTDLPTPSGYDSQIGDANITTPPPGSTSDAFLVCLDAATLTPWYGTYLGGDSDDGGEGIAVDSAGSVYIAGYTKSRDFPVFPTVNPLQGTIGDPFGAEVGDAFVTMFDDFTGANPVFSTYLGGTAKDSAEGIAIDDNDEIYIVGSTVSQGLDQVITPVGWGDDTLEDDIGPFNGDVFVARLRWFGGPLSVFYFTYLGGEELDTAEDIAVDVLGNAYVTGCTQGDFALVDPFQPVHGGGDDAFVAKLFWNEPGQAVDVLFSSYLGGAGDDQGNGIAIGPTGHIYLAGQTSSDGLGTPGASPGNSDPSDFQDGFYSVINRHGAEILHFSYLCVGTDTEALEDIAVHPSTGVYVTGSDLSDEDVIVANMGSPTLTLVRSTVTTGRGRIHPPFGDHSYLLNSEVTLVAFPDTGYVLTPSPWPAPVNSTGDENVGTIIMNGNKTVTVGFVADGLATANLNGTITSSAKAVVNCATVVLTEPGSPRMHVACVDVKGHYVFNGLRPGGYTISVYSTCCADASNDITLDPGTNTEDFLGLGPSLPAHITGTVTDTITGLPLGGVRIRAFISGDPSSGEVPTTTFTCATGQYALVFDTAPTAKVVVRYTTPGYEPKTSLIDMAKNGGGDETLELKSTLPGTLAGTVTDASTAAGLTGAQVQATLASTTTTTFTIAAGSFTLPGLEAGTYNVTVSMSGYDTAYATVVLSSGGSVVSNFYLSPTGGGGGGGGGCGGVVGPRPLNGGDMVLLAILPVVAWLAAFPKRRRLRVLART